MMPTPSRLSADLARCWQDYTEEGLPTRRKLAFAGLRAGQRIAYWVGWKAGSKRARRWT